MADTQVLRPLATGPEDTPPLYLIPGIGGHVVPYRPLARALAPHRTCIGVLHPVTARGGNLPVDTPPEILADHMAKAIAASHREGPVLLAGHSFGGLIAYEIARRLDTAGVVLLDTHLGHVWRARLQQSYLDMRRWMRQEPPPTRKVMMAQRALRRTYRPGVSDVPAVLLRARDPRSRSYFVLPKDYGWSAHLSLLGTQLVPGHHNSVLDKVHCAPWADAIHKACLRIAEPAQGRMRTA